MKYFKKWTLVKSMIASFSIFITLAVYVWHIPLRETLAPGGEVFLLLLPFFIDYLPEIFQALKGGIKILDDEMVQVFNGVEEE